MHSLLIVHHSSAAADSGRDEAGPARLLGGCGYLIESAGTREEAFDRVGATDAAVLALPLTEMNGWADLLMSRKTVPVLWWCTSATADLSVSACEDDVRIDGILSPSMQPSEMHWILHFSARRCYERAQWAKEREKLLARLEERKWIDMAKGILSKTKNISESEAYDVLRKQAMNERKRMVDVATSIVKVYQLLHEPS
ncbi:MULTISPECIES: ANTAR domain-containing response regulator [Saccharibacillus]|uniref:ANTAR domain-containing protein n=1 Tax=Saccharibacillus brassicae TaxID=2583377 RepID=A0A4Y6UWL9_SACBS|nr:MULTISPECIES: ANTAR domain-containing protein [Saccharibacillus]MWJ32849.1 ANTAR domain-containing protein [Saccharibacillus sp. WB 17]QDH21514.1 ANTAR domain-containing protein [Saccharibacillus brassicae]